MGIVLKEPAEMIEINVVIFFMILGGAKGPGIFFIIPCTDSYQKVDLRTVSFDVPPQEVSYDYLKMPPTDLGILIGNTHCGNFRLFLPLRNYICETNFGHL